MGVIDDAIRWACDIANDDTHQYVFGAQGPVNYDCTSFVTAAYREGGKLNISGVYTGNMKSKFESVGFTAISYTNGIALEPGDVLFYHKPDGNGGYTGHAIMYIGNSQIVHAKGKNYGIVLDTFYTGSWQWVMRYPFDTASDYQQVAPSNTTVNPLATNTCGITVYSDVRNSGAPNDRHDMTIREIAYWSDQNTFTTTPTDVRISAINYTTLLGNLYDQFAEYYPNGYTADRSHFTGSIRVVMDYFADHGMTPSACAGFAASLFVLSGIGTLNQGKGICNWEDSYKQDMHQKVDDWETNLTGQLDYLWTDLNLNYNNELQIINNFPVTDNGARLCANRFIVSYRYKETPQTIEEELSQSERAQDIAAEWFNKIIINPIVPYGTSYTAPTSVTIPSFNSDFELPEGNAGTGLDMMYAEVPLLPSPGAGAVYSMSECTFPQTGINTAFTSYSSWYNDWNSSSPQYKLAHLWGNQYGRTCNRGIATINGYYLVAVAPTYGSVGTALEVALENDQTFRAIIADIKSPSDANYCPWGHLDGNGRVNIIEWEVVKVLPDGTAATSGNRYAGSPPDLTGWQGVNIRYIRNLGVMFSLSWG